MILQNMEGDVPKLVARVWPLIACLALSMLSGWTTRPAAAQDVAAFYRGKTLQV